MGDAALLEMRGRLERALEIDERASHRLGKAGTSIAVATNGTGESVTLLLDRTPPQIAADGGAEITLHLDAEQAANFARGRLVVANCLMEGSVTYDGPIRKYLAVDPILRHLLRSLDGEGE